MTHRMVGGALLAALALACAAAAAPAAETAAGAPLSLREAVRQALSEGTAAKLAGLRIEESRAQGRQSRAALLPQVSAGVSQVSNMINLATEDLTLPIIPRIVGPYGMFDAHIAAAMNIVDVAALRRYRAAQQGVRVSEAERLRVRHEVAAAVAQLYVAAQRADARVGESRANVELFGRLRDLARDQWQAGVATRLDSLRAEVQLARERQNLLVATSQREVARLALLHAIGADLSLEVVLTDSLGGGPRQVPALEEALGAARRDRPELVSAEEARRAARLQVSAAKAARLPTLGVSIQGDLNGQDPGFLDGIRTVGAAVSVPLFTGGGIEAGVAEARAREREAEVQQREVERQVEEDVRRALFNYRSAANRVAVAEDNLQVAQQELEVATDRFRNGASSNIEMDNAQSSLAAARDARVTALADEAQAWYDLGRATGRIRELMPADGQ
ncbi:MAG TPA: TolC family protein [Candidatus Saccharimonadales bacterium]|nr:TolC family protein [Candidatus Saccharimonadales bacterium]